VFSQEAVAHSTPLTELQSTNPFISMCQTRSKLAPNVDLAKIQHSQSKTVKQTEDMSKRLHHTGTVISISSAFPVKASPHLMTANGWKAELA